MSDLEDPSSWRLTTLGGIPCRLIRREGVAYYDHAEGTEEMLITSQHLLPFLVESFPPFVPTAGFPRLLPRKMPGSANLFTRRVRWREHIEGLPIDPFSTDPAAPENTYKGVVHLTIDYDNTRNEEDQDPNRPETFLDINADVACEILNVSARQSKWHSTETTEGGSAHTPFPTDPDDPELQARTDPTQTQAIIVPMTEWSLTWPRLDRQWFYDVLRPRMRHAMGKVNRYRVAFLDAPPESLLFCGYKLMDQRYPFRQEDDPTQNWEGVSWNTVSVTMLMLAKDVVNPSTQENYGHNHFWRDDKHRWERVLQNGENTYKDTDLNHLFTWSSVVEAPE